MRVRTKGILLAIISASCLGMLSFLEASILQRGVAPSTLAFFQNILTGIGFLFLFVFQKKTISVRSLPLKSIVVSAILSALTIFLLNNAYSRLPASTTICIHFAYPLLTALCGVLVFRERFDLITLAALLCSFGGICLFVNASGHSAIGFFYAIASSISLTGYLIFIQHSALSRMDPVIFNLINYAFGLPVTLLLAFTSGGLVFDGITAESVLLLALLLICNMAAMLSLFMAIKLIGASLTTAFSPLEPILSTILGFTILRDPLTKRSVGGTVLILLSVLVITLRNLFFKRNNPDITA